MIIYDLKVNGIKQPMGYNFERVRVSWKVKDFTDKYQANATVIISDSSDFSNILFEATGEDVDASGVSVYMSLKPRTTYYVQASVRGINGEQAEAVTTFETAKMDEPWKADYIGTAEEDKFHPVFKKSFNLPADKTVAKARVYMTGLGVYEAVLNGTKIGEDYLAPFVNDYNDGIQYQTYDITAQLSKDNVFEIMTGNGWYKGWFGLKGTSENYGSRFAALAELHVTYTDGTEDVIVTDDTWTYYGSDIENSGIYSGEIYNHCLWGDKENPEKPVVILTEADNPNLALSNLEERISMPVKVMETLAVKEIIHTPAGETVLDFGQNFAGYIQFEADLPKGTKIELKFGEVLQNDNFYNGNYREAAAFGYTYVSGGEKETVRAHFTFFGGRYVKVIGWPGKVSADDFTGCVVYSALERTGYIETSNADINRLYLNCVWGQKSNFIDIPTDCPQRNERLGWTGDAQVFAPTASYNMDTRAFYNKFLIDLYKDQQHNDGAVANFIPDVNHEGGGSSVWGDSATFIPDTLYDFYGDEEALAAYYPLMKDWVDWIEKGDKARGEKYLFDYHFTFGDWLALDGVLPTSFKGSTDDAYVSSVYYMASAQKVAKAAEIIGKEDDAAYYTELAAKIKEAIFNEYFTPSGRLAINTQTAYLIALRFGIYKDKERLLEGFKARLKNDMYKLKGGFVGAPTMCSIMSDNGMDDLAYRIMMSEGFPGWLYPVSMGATTIWERWNSVMPDGTISPTGMNSLNHYSYGSVVEFMYKSCAGICPVEAGFKTVSFEPKINRRFSYIKASYDSVSGTYVSEWKINADGTISVHVDVPFNRNATLTLPDYDGDVIRLTPGAFDITYTPTKDYLAKYNGDTLLMDVKDDNEAMKIIANVLPQAAGMIAGGDEEFLIGSFEELKQMFYAGFNEDNVGAMIEALKPLKIKVQ